MGNLVHDKKIKAFTCEDALVSGGFVLTFGSTAGKCKKAGRTDTILGIAEKHTRDPITGDAKANKKVGVILFQEGLVVNLQLEDDNQTIAYGDPLCVTSDANEKGKVDKRDGTNETATSFARALEAVTSNTGGVIEAVLTRW